MKDFTAEINVDGKTLVAVGQVKEKEDGGEKPPAPGPGEKTWTPVEVEYKQEMNLNPDRSTNYHIEIKGDCSLAINPKEEGATGYITLVNGEGFKVTVTDWSGNALMHVSDTEVLGYYIPVSEYIKIKVV